MHHLHILASIQFAASTANVNEGDDILKLTLENSGTAGGTVCKYAYHFRPGIYRTRIANI